MLRFEDDMCAASTSSPNHNSTLIDTLLAEQRSLTAVSNFARWHDENDSGKRAKQYRNLLPLDAPRPGEQYAFEVDLDKCSGCKACVTACHALNGLDDDETWRSVGLLIGRSKLPAKTRSEDGEGSFFTPSSPTFSATRFHQHVTTACHHCVDPACLNGCPVLAYEKDATTGIVRHLDDQCIGCQYCVMMCPYDVPKYSDRLGIVRKCDLCSQRLVEGEAPACAQACPNAAIRITLVATAELLAEYRPSTAHDEEIGKAENRASGKQARRSHFPTFSPAKFLFPDACEGTTTNRFLAASPDPSITLPTTRYVSSSKATFTDLVAGDEAEIGIQATHLPLVWMLVLTQCAAGAFALMPFAAVSAQPLLTGIASVAAYLGLIGSFLHLGRPLKAWRAFLGLRRSWLSREIVSFAVLAGLAALQAIGFTFSNVLVSDWRSSLVALTAITGLFGVFCSGMVYHKTQRVFWRGQLSIGKFFGTAIVLGLATAWFASSVSGARTAWLQAWLAVVSVIRLARDFAVLRLCPDDADLSGEIPRSILARSAMLMRFELGLLLRFRLATAWFGGVVLPAVSLLVLSPGPWLAGFAALLCLMSEFMDRTLFFRSVVPFKMPGGLAA